MKAGEFYVAGKEQWATCICSFIWMGVKEALASIKLASASFASSGSLQA